MEQCCTTCLCSIQLLTKVLNHCKTTVEEITTETMLQSEGMEIKKPHCDILSEKEFIASSAEIDTHREVKLQNIEVLNINEKKIKKPCCKRETWKLKSFAVKLQWRKHS